MAKADNSIFDQVADSTELLKSKIELLNQNMLKLVDSVGILNEKLDKLVNVCYKKKGGLT